MVKIPDFGLDFLDFGILGGQLGRSTRSKYNKAIPADLLVGIRPWLDGPEIPKQQPMLLKNPPDFWWPCLVIWALSSNRSLV